MKPPNSSSTDFRPGRFRLPPNFQLWPDTAPSPPPATPGEIHVAVKFKLWPDAFPELLTPAWPVTPPIPPTVASGDLITAVHENTVSTGINDLWIDLQWLAANGANNPTTVKGDLIVNDGTTLKALPVGTDAQVLTADASLPLGIKWATPTASGGPYVPTSRQIIAGTGLVGGGALATDVTLSAVAMAASGASHKGGIVPDPGVTAGVTRYLREDATWAAPPFVPTSRQILAGAGLLGGGPLTSDVSLSATQLSASGTAHSGGIVPDPGATAGITRFLREDATWAVPPTGSGGSGQAQTPWLSAIDAAGWPLNNVANVGIRLPSQSAVPLVVQSLPSAANETVQLTAADSTSTLGLILRGYGPECGLVLSTASAPSFAWRGLAAIYSKVDTAFLTASYPGDASAVERVRILASNGNVGIAKSNPAYMLDVAGDVNISGTYRVNGVALSTGAAQTPWLSNINAASFDLNNVGHIAIGTTISAMPGTMLAISSNGATQGVRHLEQSATGAAGYVATNDSGHNCGFLIGGSNYGTAVFRSTFVIFTGSAEDILIAPAQIERVRVTSNGNVGIGKSPGAYRLDISGDCNISGTYRVNGVALSTGAAQTPWLSDVNAAGYKLYSAGGLGIGNDLSVLPTAAGGIHLVVGGSSGTLARATLASNQPISASAGALCFANYAITAAEKRIAQITGFTDGSIDSGALLFYTFQAGTLGEKMRITATGNVGVGTGNPAARIHAVSTAWGPGTVGVPAGGLVTEGAFGGGIGMIDGTKTIGLLSTNGDLNFCNGTTSTGLTTRIIMSTAGNLGIFRAPEVALDVLGSGVFRPAVQQQITSGGGLRIGFDPGGSGFGDLLSYNWSTPGFMPLQIRGAPIILGAGNVGIGPRMGPGSNPTHQLEVNVGTNMNFWFGPGAAVAGAACLHAANDNGSANIPLEIRGTPTVFAIGNVGMGGSLSPSYPLSMGASLGDRIAVWDGGPGQIYGFGIQASCLQIYSQGPTTRVAIGCGTSASLTEVLTVRGNGCVGIGYNNPNDALVIVGLPGSTQGQLRMVSGNYGVLFRNDGATCYFMVTAAGDQYGSWTANYPWQVDLASHVTTIYQLNVTASLSLSSTVTAVGVMNANGGVTSPKQIWVCSSIVASDFNSPAIQVRETNQAGAASSGDNRYAPRISFHWSGIVASQIGMDNSGTIRTFDNPGTGYAPFACAGMTVNGASGVGGALLVHGDVTVYRADGNTGAVFFTGTGSVYLYYTGTQFQLTNSLLIQGNCNITGQYQVNGVAFGGAIQVQQNGAGIGTFPTINFVNGGSGTLARCTPDTTNNRALVAIDTPSDLRIKRSVADLVGGLPAINRLRPVSFEYNGLCGFPAGKRSASIIAQELRKVLPDAVYTAPASDAEGISDLLCFDPMVITAHLILAVQELARRLRAMEQRVS